MRHRRCCDDPENLREITQVTERGGTQPRRVAHPKHDTIGLEVSLVCIVCGATLATADDRGELFADY